MVAHIIGVIGIWAGFAALALNVTAIRAAPTVRDSRQRRIRAICASVLGVAVCPLTLLITVEVVSNHSPGSVLYYGWPFMVATTDMYAGPAAPELIVNYVAFWILAPQILIYVYERVLRSRAADR
jgi:hypothetical protein